MKICGVSCCFLTLVSKISLCRYLGGAGSWCSLRHLQSSVKKSSSTVFGMARSFKSVNCVAPITVSRMALFFASFTTSLASEKNLYLHSYSENVSCLGENSSIFPKWLAIFFFQQSSSGLLTCLLCSLKSSIYLKNSSFCMFMDWHQRPLGRFQALAILLNIKTLNYKKKLFSEELY